MQLLFKNFTEWSGHIARAISLAIVIAIPWWYGSVTWEAQQYILPVVLVAILFSLPIAWKTAGVGRLGLPLVIGLLLLAAMGGFQSISLPSSLATWNGERLHSHFQPDSNESAVATNAEGGLGSASPELVEQSSTTQLPRADFEIPPATTLSLDGSVTRAAVSALAAAACLIWLGMVLFNTRKWFNVLLVTTTCVGVAIAFLGFLQEVSWNDWTLLNYRGGRAFSVFVSKNSAAAYLIIPLATALGLVIAASGSTRAGVDRRYMIKPSNVFEAITFGIQDRLVGLGPSQLAAVVGACVLFTAIVASLSRGGTVAAVGAGVVLLIAITVGLKKPSGILMTLVVIAISAGLLVYLELAQTVQEQLGTLSDNRKVQEDGRWLIWKFCGPAFAFFSLTGSGWGTFHYAYLPFQTPEARTWFYHAESVYWTLAVEGGLLALAIVLVAVVIVAVRMTKFAQNVGDRPSLAAWATLVFLVCGQAVHGIFDFGLFVPAVFGTAAIALGSCLGRLESDIKTSESRGRRKTRRLKPTGKFGSSSNQSKENANLEPAHATPINFRLIVSGCCAFAIAAASFSSLRQAAMVERLTTESQVAFEAKKIDLQELSRLDEKANQLIAAGIEDGKLFRVSAELKVAKVRSHQVMLTASSEQPLSWESTRLPLLRTAVHRLRTKGVPVKLVESLGNEDFQTLQDARSNLMAAERLTPYDWRVTWELIQLDFLDERPDTNRDRFVKLGVLAQNQPQLLEIAGMAGLDNPGPEAVRSLFRLAMASRPGTSVPLTKQLIELGQTGWLSAELYPRDPMILVDLYTQTTLSTAQPKLASDLLSLAKDIVDVLSESNPTRARVLARIAKLQGDNVEYGKRLAEASALSPMNAELRFELAQWYFGQGLLDKSLTEVAQCLRQSPTDPRYKALKAAIDEGAGAQSTPL